VARTAAAADTLAYWLLRASSAVVATLPEHAAIRGGELAGRIWHFTDSKRRSMARRHMTRVLGQGADVDGATRKMFAAYGRYWAEVLWAREKRVPGMALAVETVGIEYLQRARDEGAGLIYAVPHVGNWEVAATASVGQGVPVMAVAESLSNRRLSSWFVGLRAAFGIEAVLAEPGRSLMKELQGMVERNGAAALLCDRDLRGRGVPVKFFGEQTTLPAGPVWLAMRSGAALLPVACFFLEGPGHRLVVLPPIRVPEEGTRAERIAAGTQLVAAALEELVRMAPSQWHLLQPNWPSDRTG
jgi:phosphatidylinositol dimannoside acyltransferase